MLNYTWDVLNRDLEKVGSENPAQFGLRRAKEKYGMDVSDSLPEELLLDVFMPLYVAFQPKNTLYSLSDAVKEFDLRIKYVWYQMTGKRLKRVEFPGDV
jgi:hypothetical protein